jgi:hypothetical protein
MRSVARIAAVTVLTPALLATACTSSTKHTPAPSTSASSVSAATVAAQLRAGIDGLTSAGVIAHAGSLLDSLTGELALHSGTVTASHLVIGTGSSAATVITVGSTSYAKLPKVQNGKAWALVTSSSKNSFVLALAPTLSVVQAATELNSIADLVATGTGVRSLGAATVNGTPTTHYALTLHGSSTGSGLSTVLALAGASGVPADLWLDSTGRPVQVQIVLSALKVTAVITLTNFNAPVTITAPAASQVAQ